MQEIKLRDESLSGNILNEILVQIESERTTVRDLIQARVYQEVARHNAHLSEYFTGLVQPTEAEVSLNGYKLKTRRTLDAEQQFYIALEAFQNNGFFILVDNRQAEQLDEEILLSEGTRISFVKLTPLVGG
ncbi:MAG: hypothetical protein HC913_07840 [Microscillaceae bacterium]|nr:hypothetical protein [Microscillaceae bacterium]